MPDRTARQLQLLGRAAGYLRGDPSSLLGAALAAALLAAAALGVCLAPSRGAAAASAALFFAVLTAAPAALCRRAACRLMGLPARWSGLPSAWWRLLRTYWGWGRNTAPGRLGMSYLIPAAICEGLGPEATRRMTRAAVVEETALAHDVDLLGELVVSVSAALALAGCVAAGALVVLVPSASLLGWAIAAGVLLAVAWLGSCAQAYAVAAYLRSTGSGQAAELEKILAAPGPLPPPSGIRLSQVPNDLLISALAAAVILFPAGVRVLGRGAQARVTSAPVCSLHVCSVTVQFQAGPGDAPNTAVEVSRRRSRGLAVDGPIDIVYLPVNPDRAVAREDGGLRFVRLLWVTVLAVALRAWVVRSRLTAIYARWLARRR